MLLSPSLTGVTQWMLKEGLNVKDTNKNIIASFKFLLHLLIYFCFCNIKTEVLSHYGKVNFTPESLDCSVRSELFAELELM